MFKKIVYSLTILIVIFAGILFFSKNQVKSFIKKNPVVYNLVRTVVAKVSVINPFDSSLGNLDKNESMQEAHFTIDFRKESGSYKKFWQGLGQDSFNDGFLKPHNRAYYQLIGEMNQVRPVFQSAHSKGMLCDTWHVENTCGSVYTKDRNGVINYDWTITDEVFDLLLNNGLKPLVSFTYMPSNLASDPKKVNPWNKSNVSPPNDYREWQDLIYKTVVHLKNRYGEREITNWYFEVWNEPDLPWFFWVNHPDKQTYPYKGDNKEYFKLYDYTAQAAAKALPAIKIGGPAIAGDIDFFINDWLPHCQSGRNYASGRKGTRVDFLSMHAYGNIETKILPGIIRFIDKAKENGKKITKRADFLITEYGPSAKPEPWLNSRYVAAWIVKFVDGILFLGNEKGRKYIPNLAYFWTKPVPANFGKHFGLATAFGHPKHPRANSIVKRPVFNGFDALSRLGSVQLEVKGTDFGDPIHAIATRSSSNEIEVLLYHLDESDPYNESRQTFPVSISITNLPFRSFRTELYVIDESHSNSYTLWKEMGEPDRPTREQLQKLQQNDDLALIASQTEVTPANQSFRTEMEIQSNSVALLVLIPIQTNDGKGVL